MDTRKIHFTAMTTDTARETLAALVARYGNLPEEEADVIVTIGGDGFMLDTLKRFLDSGKPIFGLNRGTVGFLMNAPHESDLPERIAAAERIEVSPLEMIAHTQDGENHRALAFNEVSMFRETRQTARIEISVNGKVRMERLVCDGVLLSTPIGSTAYNLSAHGPILPPDAEMLALTPISPFRPRRWRGALLPISAEVAFRVIDPQKRPVSAVADNVEVRDVDMVKARINTAHRMTLLFDPDQPLQERIIREQFDY